MLTKNNFRIYVQILVAAKQESEKAASVFTKKKLRTTSYSFGKYAVIQNFFSLELTIHNMIKS
jgi:hypothetical protein